MIYIGLDDTDMLDTPGTNKLAQHLAALESDRYEVELIVRHQLLVDPRVPCTNKNGCASMLWRPLVDEPIAALAARLRTAILDWIPKGSDPGLCLTREVPEAVLQFGILCQRELILQQDARSLAAEQGIHLEGLAGTEGGVIGALAAVGLLASRNDGRVVYRGEPASSSSEWGFVHAVDELLTYAVDAIVRFDSGEEVVRGVVDLGKRLRPNLRGGRVVLFVEPSAAGTADTPAWTAVRVT